MYFTQLHKRKWRERNSPSNLFEWNICIKFILNCKTCNLKLSKQMFKWPVWLELIKRVLTVVSHNLSKTDHTNYVPKKLHFLNLLFFTTMLDLKIQLSSPPKQYQWIHVLKSKSDVDLVLFYIFNRTFSSQLHRCIVRGIITGMKGSTKLSPVFNTDERCNDILFSFACTTDRRKISQQWAVSFSRENHCKWPGSSYHEWRNWC